MAWGVMLVLAGVGVFFRVEQVLPRIEAHFEYFTAIRWFVRFSFYLMGVVLIGGGIRKIYRLRTRAVQESSDAR